METAVSHRWNSSFKQWKLIKRFLTDAVYNGWNQFIPLCHNFRVEDTDM